MGNSELKKKALEQLKGHWVQAVIVGVIFWLLTVSYTTGKSTYKEFKYICENGTLIGIDQINESQNKKLAWAIGLLLDGAMNFGLVAFFLKLVRKGETAISDIFSGFKYYIKTFVLNLLYVIFILLWTLLLIFPGIIAAFNYSMAYYIMHDNPEIGGYEAIEISKKMMDGHKGELLYLYFSFLGWFILEIVTFGIASIWIQPYFYATKANFYEDIKDGI